MPRERKELGNSNRSGLASTIGSIAHSIEQVLPNGEVAQLRRLRPDEAASPAFWKVVVAHLEPDGQLPEGEGPLREDLERRWAVILRGMAEMKGLHRPRRRLGTALAEAGVAEPRVLRLLRSADEVLHETLRTTVHQLATKAEPIDWTDAAFLVLTDGRSREESVRRSIARAFYARHRD